MAEDEESGRIKAEYGRMSYERVSGIDEAKDELDRAEMFTDDGTKSLRDTVKNESAGGRARAEEERMSGRGGVGEDGARLRAGRREDERGIKGGKAEGERAGKGRPEMEGRHRDHRHRMHRGILGQNWIGYFNSLAGILPDPDEVCQDVEINEGNSNVNAKTNAKTEQTKGKGVIQKPMKAKHELERVLRQHPRHSANNITTLTVNPLSSVLTPDYDLNSNGRRPYGHIEREIQELDSHPVVQSMRKRRDERMSKSGSSVEERALAERRGQSARRGLPMEERIAELKRKISAYSDVEQKDLKSTERRGKNAGKQQ